MERHLANRITSRVSRAKRKVQKKQREQSEASGEVNLEEDVVHEGANVRTTNLPSGSTGGRVNYDITDIRGRAEVGPGIRRVEEHVNGERIGLQPLTQVGL